MREECFSCRRELVEMDTVGPVVFLACKWCMIGYMKEDGELRKLWSP
jgi:hypothetical protein